MKKLNLKLLLVLIFAGLTFSFSSCDKVNENLLIVIKNRTDTPVHIQLFPKETNESGDLYPMSDSGGPHQAVESDLPLNAEQVLYYSNDLTVKPYTLVSNIFDSIYVRNPNSDIIIIFTHNSVVGYSENIFAENSPWDYNVEEWSKGTRRNSQVWDYRYTFIIYEEKINITQKK